MIHPDEDGARPMKRRFKYPCNRKGRPKGAKNRKTIAKAVANEKQTIKMKGERRRLSNLEIVLLRLRNLALDGDLRAFVEFDRVITVYQPQETDEQMCCLVVPAPMTPDEAIAEGNKANEEARARRAARLKE